MKLVLTAERQRRCVICDLHDNGSGSQLGNGNYLLKGDGKTGGALGWALGVGLLAVPITVASELLPLRLLECAGGAGEERGRVKRVEGSVSGDAFELGCRWVAAGACVGAGRAQHTGRLPRAPKRG